MKEPAGSTLKSLPAVFMRGGTSKAVFFRREALPQADDPHGNASWDVIFRAAMGSPDAKGRQLDGMGGGLSSLSKIAVIARSENPQADVDFTFAQVGVRDGIIGYRGTCGNITAAVAVYALNEGLAPSDEDRSVVRIFNTNTNKYVVATVPMDAAEPAVVSDTLFATEAERGIRLSFLQPGGAATGSLLPSGRSREVLDIEGFGPLTVSCIDAANPTVFVAGAALGIKEIPSPTDLESQPDLLNLMEAVRSSAARAMQLARSENELSTLKNLPLVALLFPAATGEAASVHTRMISAGQPHRATPLTGAMCLAVAAQIPDSLVIEAIGGRNQTPLLIGHASGIIRVEANVSQLNQGPYAQEVTVYRTARRLMEGRIFFPQEP